MHHVALHCIHRMHRRTAPCNCLSVRMRREELDCRTVTRARLGVLFGLFFGTCLVFLKVFGGVCACGGGGGGGGGGESPVM